MDDPLATNDAAARSATEAAPGDVHVGAFAVGGAFGAALAALLIGSVVLLLLIVLGAFAGAVVCGFGAFIVDKLHGIKNRSGDHPSPSLISDGSPAAQRSEAGHTSPSAS